MLFEIVCKYLSAVFKEEQTFPNGKQWNKVAPIAGQRWGGGQFCQFPEEYNLLYLKTEDLNCAALGEKYLDPADISENQIDYLITYRH